jgi:hypothetical protein
VSPLRPTDRLAIESEPIQGSNVFASWGLSVAPGELVGHPLCTLWQDRPGNAAYGAGPAHLVYPTNAFD